MQESSELSSASIATTWAGLSHCNCLRTRANRLNPAHLPNSTSTCDVASRFWVPPLTPCQTQIFLTPVSKSSHLNPIAWEQHQSDLGSSPHKPECFANRRGRRRAKRVSLQWVEPVRTPCQTVAPCNHVLSISLVHRDPLICRGELPTLATIHLATTRSNPEMERTKTLLSSDGDPPVPAPTVRYVLSVN